MNKTSFSSIPQRGYKRGHKSASKDGFGVVLMQKIDEDLHSVAYWSKRTSESDAKRYSYMLEVKSITC